MKSFKIVIFAVLVLSVGVALAFAMQHEASVEKGKVLFNDPKLGTTGKSLTTAIRTARDWTRQGQILILKRS